MEEQHTARLLLLDPDNRILLMRIAEQSPDSGSHLWVTLGGRLEPGESILICAERELHEETGISGASVGPVIWYGEQTLQRNGRSRFLKENFVLARCDTTSLTDTGWTPDERRAIAEMRWWTLDELSTTSHVVKPPGLPVLLHDLFSTLHETNRDSPGARVIDLQ